MYAEPGFLLPYFHSFPTDYQQIEEMCRFHNQTATISTIFEYDLGDEGDLFKAPEPIIEESTLPLDPVTTAAISLISGDPADDVLASQALEVVATQLEPIHGDGPLMADAFYEVKKDLIEKSAIDEDFLVIPQPTIPETKIPALDAEDDEAATNLQKSVSSGCLTSMEWVNNAGPIRPAFLDFQRLNLEDAFGMRRAFSEGDIQTLGNGKAGLLSAPCERPLTIGNYTIEERKQRLHRYRNKKTKRNFNRKIKYACRKALADSQPRIRGRFAKTEDSESSKASSSASGTKYT
ncbi:Zinc finger protein CONSTANS-LIKE 4 [Nymphaea thermarum]|nr:Zinc finger protein CONSTANS-LIKE 4 [Nymphaea thermarum]